MGFYNVSVRDYGGGKKQIRLFARPVQDDFELDDHDRFLDDLSGDLSLLPSGDAVDREGVPDHSAYESYRRSKQAVYDIARANKWDWFFTLTFNPALVDSFDYDAVTCKLSKWLNNLRRSCPDLKYLLVPEKHKSGRFHFHGLFANVDPSLLSDSGHVDRSGRVVFNLGNYKLGFSTVTAVSSSDTAVGYLLKYVSKDLCSVTKFKKRYWQSRNLNKVQISNFYYTTSLEVAIKTFGEGCVWSKTVSSEFNKIIYLEIEEGS